MAISALTRVQFELAGGWRQTLVLLGVYAALLVLVAGIAFRVAGPQGARDVHSGLLVVVSLAQGGVLLVLAPGVIRRAVLRDFQTGMADSLRLTPMTGWQLTLGYVSGATAQLGIFYLLGLLAGSYFALSFGLSWNTPGMTVGGWYLSQLGLLPLALLLVSATLLVALSTRGKTNLVPMFVFLSLIGGWGLIWVVPGLAVLLGVASASVVLTMITGARGAISDPNVIGWSMLLQFVYAVVLLAGAARKVRYPHAPAFSLPLGFILLGLTALTLIVGTRYPLDSGQVGDAVGATWRWIAAAGVYLVVALVPLGTAAAAALARHRAQAIRLPEKLLAPAGLVLGVAAVAAAPLAYVRPAELGAGPPAWTWIATVLAVLISCWLDYHVLYLALARGMSVVRVVLFTWLVLRIVPLALEIVSWVVEGDDSLSGAGAAFLVGQFSPFGTLFATTLGGHVIAGLIVQAALAAVVTLLALRAGARLGAANVRGGTV